MPRKFSLYLPTVSLGLVVYGVSEYSVGAACIVGGATVLAAWGVYVALAVKAAK